MTPSTTPTGGNGQTTGHASTPFTPPQPLADEQALERLFRAHFASLAGEARAKLGEGAAAGAPRVVEMAFRRAWAERQRLTTEQEAVAFLHAAVQDGASRELSRRAAAHHLGGKGAGEGGAHHAPPPVASPEQQLEQTWGKLHAALHPEERPDVGHEQAQALRHEAAQHVASLAAGRSWRGAALVGVIAVALAGAGVWYIDKLGAEGRVTRALTASDAKSYPAAAGQFAIVTLDDATKVTLAPMSKLTVPKRFGDGMRVVGVSGAATFAVAPGGEQPFQVRAGNAAVIATGTTITVAAYPGDAGVIVKLHDGTATVKVGEAEHSVASGSTILVQPDGGVRAATAAEQDEALAWTERRIALADRPLRTLVQQMNRLYGVDIKVTEAALLDRPGSVRAPLDSMRTAIAQVEQSTGAAFSYDGKTMIFRSKEAGKEKGAPRPRR